MMTTTNDHLKVHIISQDEDTDFGEFNVRVCPRVDEFIRLWIDEVWKTYKVMDVIHWLTEGPTGGNVFCTQTIRILVEDA